MGADSRTYATALDFKVCSGQQRSRKVKEKTEKKRKRERENDAHVYIRYVLIISFWLVGIIVERRKRTELDRLSFSLSSR